MQALSPHLVKDKTAWNEFKEGLRNCKVQQVDVWRSAEEIRNFFFRETETPWRLNWSVQDSHRKDQESGQGQVLHACLEWSRTTWPHLDVVQAEMQVHNKKVILLSSPTEWSTSGTVCRNVVDATTVNMFKNRLDKTWKDMGSYSWEADWLIINKYK